LSKLCSGAAVVDFERFLSLRARGEDERVEQSAQAGCRRESPCAQLRTVPRARERRGRQGDAAEMRS